MAHTSLSGGASLVRSVLKRTFAFPAFLGALLLAGVFASVCLKLQRIEPPQISIFEGDTWYHILEGEQILALRRQSQ